MSAQPPPPLFQAVLVRAAALQLGLAARSSCLVQLPRRMGKAPKLLADQLRLIKDIYEAAYNQWQTAQS